MNIQELLLAPEEIGDNLDLEVEAEYPCSDGGITMTISVDNLLKAQLAKAKPIIEKQIKQELCGNCDTPLFREGELYQKLEEAKKQERERIADEIRGKWEMLATDGKDKCYAIISMEIIEQALKGEE